MADKTNPNGGKTSSSELLPRYYRTDANKKFLQATVDQLIQPGTVKKVNGFVGRQNSKSTTGDDIFIKAADSARQDYQLEPGLVIKDTIGNTTFFKDYQDYINQLNVFGANTKNHARLNEQEFYSWDPHIDWDKFVNFQQYYWMPYGPDVIRIHGVQGAIVSSYSVEIKPEADNNTYVFFPNGLTENPSIQLYRGQTYRFEINSPGNPFSIKVKRAPGNDNLYDIPGITGSSVEKGVIEFSVPLDAPNLLYYVSDTDINLGGVFEILSIDDGTTFNVETQILGKSSYVLPDGTALSNGMKVSFVGNTIPESYKIGEYYVEGVGESITLINETVLNLISPYSSSESILFDGDPFDSVPFGDATSIAATKDHVVINRRSQERSPWSRYNRWIHKDVIEASAKYNGKTASIDQTARAVRPIIEFEPNLKLFNFGTKSIPDVDLIDTYTTDVFSKIEGQLGYNIDNIPLAQGQRILFSADTDVRVKGKIFRVNFLVLDGTRQIHLVEEETPVKYDVVLVKQGKINQGLMFWYDGSEWHQAQQKTTVNQAPLFDLFDLSDNSLGDKTMYDGSTFKGTKIFSYKTGSGTADTVLGFPLSYKNISNIGDIVFNFNIASDTFEYKDVVEIIEAKTNSAYLLRTMPNGDIEYVNGWQTSESTHNQAAIRIYKNSNKVNNFEIDIFEDVNNLADLEVRIYVNGVRLNKEYWTIQDALPYKKVVLVNDITTADILTIRAFAKQPINSNGYYEVPISLQNNPLNDEMKDFTLGEISSHLDSIIDNIQDMFSGIFPGPSNIRNLGNITRFGTRFVQHSGPLSIAAYHLTSQTNNIIRAIESAQTDYNRFKRNFISVAETLGIDTDPVRHVNLILQEINKDKPKSFPYYFSDMVPYAGSTKTVLTVFDYRIKTYPLTTTFNLDSLSSKAVLVYLNDEQLLYKKDYTFNDQGFVVISAELVNDDLITIYEFETTNGCFVPPTPTKLGIWPKYEPKIYTDTSLVTPRVMIQGHDGSQVLAYGDYRDELILELEKRIFNNIKIEYDPTIFDLSDYLPVYNRHTPYSLNEFNEVLSANFYSWSVLIDRDFSRPLSYDNQDPRTYNYREMATPDGVSPLPGYWKGIHRWLLETDRPNICPWEMVGFTIQPKWWEEVYGPAPYTSDNLILWDDMANGIIREPGKPPTQNKKYVRSYLKGRVPVDDGGNIISPLESGLASGIITNSTAGDFVFGDVSPVESAWRRGSYYPYGVLITLLLTNPAKIFGLALDRSRIVRNKAGQLVYKDTGVRVRPSDIVLPSIYSSNTDVRTSGIINFIVDYIQSDKLKSYSQYQEDLKNVQIRLTHRIGGFTSKEKYQLLLDSKTPLSSGSVFVPQEDYEIILNTSSPVKKIIYSGVVITKFPDGYVIKGYSKTQPFFKYYNWVKAGMPVNVGGISESYTVWNPDNQYVAGKIIAYSNRYYRVKTLHTTTSTFNPSYYTLLPSLPIVGGKEALIRTAWDRTEDLVLPYGTKLRDIQDVVDFLLGYGEYLKDQGFIFDNFNNELGAITNWETSAKEFLFWTTQNWSTGEDKWKNWSANQPVTLGDIVKYNGEYYRAVNNLDPSPVFEYENYVKLDGLSAIGSSVISLSPSATNVIFSAPISVVDDIRNHFNKYEIFKVDGTPISPQFLNNYRDENAVSYTPVDDGIYGATFYLVQKEQVVILNNTTLFNDTIYNPESGYRQERIKVAGYVSSNWRGDFNIPGFIFDQAVIQDWESWKDYALGDIVKYKQFYYTAKQSMAGAELFNSPDWIKLDKKPTPQLLPNWTYKASQFEDFYSLDSDNFDADQQAVAQHLIGYQKRNYLNNIIKDDVSEFKFYQGMIVEKGTQNVLNKLFDVLSADGEESVTFYEEWALRTGQYGASSSFESIEFVIDEQLVKSNPQGFELVNNVDQSVVDFIIRQTPNDLYVKPLGYNNSPWPLLKNTTEVLRTPGYVRSSDVTTVLRTMDDITTQTISNFVDGDYVWVGFEGRGWNVYRFSKLDFKVKDITYDNGKITVTVNNSINFAIGDYVGIDQTKDYNGFYKVTNVSSETIELYGLRSEQPKQFKDQAKAVLAYFVSHRASTVDSIDQVVHYPVKDSELIWTDDAGDGKWAAWKHTNVYAKSDITNSSPEAGLEYGRRVLLNSKGNLSLISTSQGDSIVLSKSSTQSPWIQHQTITAPFISKDGVTGHNNSPDSYTGDVMALSYDSKWLAIGTPLATEVCSLYKGVWSPGTTYTTGDIVIRNGVPYASLSTSNVGNAPETTDHTYSAVTGTVLTGAGTGAIFEVTASNTTYSVTVTDGGSAFAPGDTIRIFGSSVGGSAPANNILIKVLSVSGTNATGPIARVLVTGNAKDYWAEVPYIPVDSTGTNSTLQKQGVVSIYQKDSSDTFSLVATVLSPMPASNELFGSSLAFGNDALFIGATGYNNGQGKVYRLSYKTITEVKTSYNPIGSSGTKLVLTSTASIQLGMYLKGVGFTSGQYVSAIDQATNSITISAVPDSTPSGSIEFTTTSWRYDPTNVITSPVAVGSNFGDVLSISADGSTLLVSATKHSPYGQVFVYNTTNNVSYTLKQTIPGTDEQFGSSVTVSNTGEYVAIASIFKDDTETDQGSVIVYNFNGTRYEPYQTLKNTRPEPSQFFGTNISFMNDYQTLVVFSKGSDNVFETTYDQGATTFDDGFTAWYDVTPNNGRVDIYDRYSTKWVYSESLENPLEEISEYSDGFAVANNQVIIGAPAATDQGHQSGKVFAYSKTAGALSWQVLHKENEKVDISKIKRAFLYNKVTNKLISYLDVIDSTQGKIPGIADAEIKYKTFYDPAVYSSGTADVNVDEGMAWTKSQVGTLWWDLRTAKFIDSHDTDLIYRNSTWNTIFDFASIDVYEWVETKYNPDQWNNLADTEEGLSAGISGTSLYGNSVYSLVRRYDNVSKSFRNTYYFWVKNKKTTPGLANRNMSASDVKALIENPRGMDYRYIALTGANSFSLVNVAPLLRDKDVVLTVEYWTSDKTDKNIHSQWKVISNNIKTDIPAGIEQKWFDSLCGKDSQGRLVPDTALPAKLKYGVENRPRQGMFVNRFEALKQFIEYVNIELAKQLIVENRDISKLEAYEAEPSTITGLYDSVVDTDAELRFASIGTYEKPKFEPVIENGRITGINILSKGKGYFVAPYFTISGQGVGAKIKAKIDTRGQIVGIDIISSGEGYTADTTVTLRNYSILVHSDSAAGGNWSIYSYEPTTLVWSRVQSQGYDVRQYWSYMDWYQTGYNQFTAIDHVIDTFPELQGLTTLVGQTVKVKTTSLGTWVLLEKYADSVSVDWTQSYQVVGRENGTIQFLSGLYKFENSQYGYDGSLYDSSMFDNSASVELRIILDTLKNNILTDDLKSVYLNLFFNSVRYAFSEQNYIDWIFKTSFVKAEHKVGDLKQKVTYNSDNLENFEDYINEVKPYRTKVREYVSSYNKIDQSQISTTDFDLPPIYENGNLLPITTSIVDGVIQSDNAAVLDYPWRHWYDNIGFSVVSLSIVDGGSGYTAAPVVRIVSNTGSGATGRAFVANGKVNRIVLLTKGEKYLSAPTVILDGGLAVGGVAGRAVATIGEGVVRSNLIKVKFDRVSQKYYITNLQETEQISDASIVSGSRLQFELKWAPDVTNTFINNVKLGKATVLVNDVEVLKDSYTLSVKTSTSKGFTSYYGVITFTTAPTKGSTITVNYTKDWALLNATDRIQYYYDPAVGEIGKDLAQLMTGIDYGGVNVHGLNFDVGSGWGSVPYYTDKWGSIDEKFDDFIVTVAAGTHDFTVPYVPAAGTEMNVYYVGKNVDSYADDGFSTVYNFNINDVYPPTVTVEITRTFTGTNAAGTNTINISSTTGIKVGDVLTMSPNVDKTLGYNTVVTQIVGPTQVKIDQILFKSITAGHNAIFTRTLVDPTDCTINPNGTVELVEPIPTGSVIYATAYTNPVRLDDPNYDVTGVALEDLSSIEFQYQLVVNSYNGLIDDKFAAEQELAGVQTQLENEQATLNALLVVIDGLDPLDPLYNPTVSDINILINTTIPATEAAIADLENTIQALDADIATNTTDKTVLAAEVDAQIAYINGLTPLANTTAIMQTIISDGVADNQLDPTYKTFSIPGTFTVSEGDKFIWRKASSDGSVLPQDQDYDTAISGGDLAYNSARGISADDIIIDGDDFVSPTTSPATEEVVPGQVVDTVAIKVYDKPDQGSATIRVDSYIADGVQTSFRISQQPNTKTALIVKFANGTRDPISNILIPVSSVKTLGVDYTVDYRNNMIEFITPPPHGELVSIFSFGFNGSNILDLDYFVGDGVTKEFVTKAAWVNDDVTYLVYIDGEAPVPGTPQLFKTDSSYEVANRTGLLFSNPPDVGAIINYVIVRGAQQTYSVTKTERFPGNGTDTYPLQNIVGDSLPVESSMLVRVNNSYLQGPNNSYYTIAGTRVNYSIDPVKYLPYTLSINDIYVYAGGVLLTSGIDYIVDLSGINVKITQNVRKKYLNKELIISIKQTQEYTYIAPSGTQPPKIQFVKTYTADDVIEVLSSYKHDILDIQRTAVNVTSNFALTPDTPEFYNYKAVAGGVIQLDRSVLNENYVWVIKNKTLLTPSADFILNADRKSIKLAFYPDPADVFTIITYGSNILTSGVSYMQFKDMLNRLHFKRLNANKRTRLVKSLQYTDTTIEVEDASSFDQPNISKNKPGIIEIRGERIEFFTLNTKVTEGVTTYVLGQLRRGTLGTGVSKVHRAGSFVQDLGPSETIPYVENTLIEQIKSDGTNIVPLSFIPMNPATGVVPANDWSYDAGYVSSIPSGYTQADDIEVFVGGYTTVPWATGVEYKVDDIVEVGSYTYRCVTAHTSSVFAEESSNWVFFVGNIRLKKQPYHVHNVNNAPYSPEGDIQLDAEFAVDAENKQLRLTNKLEFGTRVTVIRRTGAAWDSTTNILNDSSKISRFLKAVPGIWYAELGKYENKAGLPSSFDSENGTFDSSSITFDQG